MDVRSLKALLTWCVAKCVATALRPRRAPGVDGLRWDADAPASKAYGCEYSAPRSVPISPQTR